MAIKVDRINGQNYADNIVDTLLMFDSGTWSTANGTGTATLDTNNIFVGDSSLKIENNVPASDYLVSNSSQSTYISTIDNYQLSWYIKKDIADEVRTGDVLIFKNAVLLDTQTFSIGDTDSEFDQNNEWVRFQSDAVYPLGKADIITFQFKLKAATTAELTTKIYVDGVMLNRAERGNTIVPFYTKPEISKQVFGSYNYQDDGTSITTVSVANSWYTVENNGGGALSTNLGGFTGITPYNTSTNEFNLSSLSLYDEVELRLDLKASTTTSNDTVLFRLNIADGAAYLNLFSKEYDLSITDDQVVIYIPVGVLTELAKTDGFTLECSSNASGTTVKTNGYYIKVNKRFI